MYHKRLKVIKVHINYIFIERVVFSLGTVQFRKKEKKTTQLSTSLASSDLQTAAEVQVFHTAQQASELPQGT